MATASTVFIMQAPDHTESHRNNPGGEKTKNTQLSDFVRIIVPMEVGTELWCCVQCQTILP